MKVREANVKVTVKQKHMFFKQRIREGNVKAVTGFRQDFRKGFVKLSNLVYKCVAQRSSSLLGYFL